MKRTLEQIIAEFGGTPADWSTTETTGWIHRDAEIDPGVIVGPEAIIRNGTFRDGTFRDGTFRGGTFRGGTFWGGTFRGGTFRGGTFEGGTFEGGTFEGGTFEGGTFEGGTFEGGTFEGGTFQGGTFQGGTFEGGTFEGGTFQGGEILGGTWNRAPLFVQGSRHLATNAKPGHLKVGCRCEPFAWWLSPEAETFARENGYSGEEIAEYRAIVELFIKIGV